MLKALRGARLISLALLFGLLLSDGLGCASASVLPRALTTAAFALPALPRHSSAVCSSFPIVIMNEELRRIRRERWLAAAAASNGAVPSRDGRRGRTAPSAAALASSSAAASITSTSSASSYTSRSSSFYGVGDAPASSKPPTKPAGAIDLTAGSSDDDDDVSPPRKKSRAVGAKGNSSSLRSIDMTDEDSKMASGTQKNPSWKRPRAVRPKSPDRRVSPLTSSSRPQQNGPPTPFSVATYNVWFGPPHPEARMAKIASLLSVPRTSNGNGAVGGVGGGGKPVFLGLQELTAPLASVLFPLLRSEGYNVVARDDFSAAGGYGCAVAVLTRGAVGGAEVLSSGVRPYSDTIMGRGVVWAHARLGCDDKERGGSSSREVLFCTTHLESYVPNHPATGMTYDGATQRRSQIQEAASFCAQFARRHGNVKVAMITGDLNWDDERKRSASGNDPPLLNVLNDDGDDDDAWIDAWRTARGSEDGYTYDARLSPMLRGNLRRRFDRCLIRTFGGGGGGGGENEGQSGTRIEGAELIGTEPIERLVWRKEKMRWGGGRGGGTGEFFDLPVLPSDHYGLRVDLR